MLALSTALEAQTPSVDVGGHVSVLRLGESDTTSVGVGGDVSWRVTPVIAVDGAVTWFPAGGDLMKGAFESQDRVLGLTGVKAIATRGGAEFFARGRVGFLRFREGPPLVCILIFPPPLGCQLAGGYTAFASELGGGASIGVGASDRLRVEIEAGDLLVRYGLEALRTGNQKTDGFVSHNPLLTLGFAWRF
jgi:hypothetical protein